jgi:Signal transduction histidine kinase
MHTITSETGRTFESKVEGLLNLGRELLDADHGVLSRMTGDEYRFEVAQSPHPGFQAGKIMPLSAAVCERTVTEQGQVVIANIIEDTPDIADRIENAADGVPQSTRCYVGAPVFVDGEVYGTFCFYDGEPREEGFTDWETTIVDVMAQWVGYELTRQQTNERLRRQNERLEEFVSVVSHDLRNPLETLSGHLEFAERTGDPEHFEWCYTAVDRMEALIDDLLTLARAGETVGETEPVDLARVVTECWEIIDPESADLVVETDRTVHADRSRLRQLLENLLRNSVEHSSAGSRGSADDPIEDGGVTVTVGDTESGFYIADDGPGVPRADRETVFEAGYSTLDDGTGFGLQIVEQVAETHGWSVRLVEAEDGGARFEFTL